MTFWVAIVTLFVSLEALVSGRVAAAQGNRMIDWTELARKQGSFSSGGISVARKALAAILGEAEIAHAVAHYIKGEPGSEVARSVLSMVRPKAAMAECYRIYREASDPNERTMAVELLRVVADATALPWIHEFLDDANQGVRVWGVGVLDYLVMSDLVDDHEEEVVALLDRIETFDALRERGEDIRRDFQRRFDE
ncbi:MAG: hypothetical protein AAGE52_30015 [Myxococcota bacterium]